METPGWKTNSARLFVLHWMRVDVVSWLAGGFFVPFVNGDDADEVCVRVFSEVVKMINLIKENAR